MNSTETAIPADLHPPGDAPAVVKYCLFRSGDSWFAIPAIAVHEIAACPALVPVPHSGPALAGMCHLRSEFNPVIALNPLLRSDEASGVRGDNQLLVIQSSSVWSLLIAEAAGIVSLETLVTPESRGDDRIQTPVIGTSMFRDHIVHVLDPGGILRLAQQTLESLWNVAGQEVAASPTHVRSQG
ncbi:chemotaxis protein CheW [Roseimaritima ulvae]|uniref:CheW-like domain protein n=1 Tax=Roseimaritima ulvae TaxID=980254 RepID=A0A5B9QPM6_9BACT|nr:chemotaxis protein CheW [Roseimaritima ulvae]QEG41047.1 CheW-like domain protein [Roseimaritima ulvae]